MFELELVEAAAAPFTARDRGPTGAAKLEGFSLIFNGPGERLLPQGTHRFEHDQKGRFDLFMVPVGFVACGMGATSVREWLRARRVFLVSVRFALVPEHGTEASRAECFHARQEHLA